MNIIKIKEYHSAIKQMLSKSDRFSAEEISLLQEVLILFEKLETEELKRSEKGEVANKSDPKTEMLVINILHVLVRFLSNPDVLDKLSDLFK